MLAALSLGCGLLADRASRRSIPGPLIVPVGVAVIVAVGDLLTRWADAASLTPWALVALAVAGFVLGLRARLRAPEWPPVAVALSVFAVYAAPIVLSGEATFAGYVTLDDTATWLAITDQLMDRGHDLSQLPPSSHEATLAFTLARGYPVGSFLPLGTGASITGIDPAWAFQPYLAVLGACLGLALWSLLRPLVPSCGLRGVCAFIAAQPALLFGYALWGGLKELIAAALIATLAGLARSGLVEDRRGRALIPIAIVVVALLSALSAGGLVWAVPILAAPIAVRLAGDRPALRIARPVVIAAGALAALCALALALGIRPAPKGAFGLVEGEVLGNLIGPLSPLQIAGVWLSGDFRIDPDQKLLAYLLVAAVAGLYGLGAWRAIRSGAISLFAYGVGTVVVALGVVAIASPWLGAKALAIASPAALTLAVGGAASLRGRRTEMVVALGVLAAGVLWSNLLAYEEASLAPRERLGELEHLGGELADEGPTLMTAYEPYGVRHFLRDAAPEGVSELRRREIRLRDGTLAPKGDSVDTDEIRLDDLLIYRTLVLRRSPLASRPPAPYRLVSRGRYYDVWQRPRRGGRAVIEHLSLSEGDAPGGRAPCRRVERLRRVARERGGHLVAARAGAPRIVPLTSFEHPADWDTGAGGPGQVVPASDGEATEAIEVDRGGEYSVWLGGSLGPGISLAVDGRRLDSPGPDRGTADQFTELFTGELSAGGHDLLVERSGTLAPGGELRTAVGPLVVEPARDGGEGSGGLRSPGVRAACGRSWDWLEVVS